jgi:hypothetical protein
MHTAAGFPAKAWGVKASTWVITILIILSLSVLAADRQRHPARAVALGSFARHPRSQRRVRGCRAGERVAEMGWAARG